MFELTGKVALITGAGQGIGAGIARTLAAQGATVVVNDIRSEPAAAVAAQIVAAGGSASTAVFDVTSTEQVDAAVAGIVASVGPIDILVNNAGNGGAHGMTPTPFHAMDPSAWNGPIDVNLFGVLNCCRSVINPMRERGRGRVITIASGAGMVGLGIGVSPYAAGKGGAISFMRHLAIENAKAGITANTLAIGLMARDDETGSPADRQDGVTSALARQIPIGRLGTPKDIGAFCAFLASDEAEWVTAQTFHVNGGSVTS